MKARRLLVNIPPGLHYRYEKQLVTELALEAARAAGHEVTEHPEVKGVWLIKERAE